MSGRNLAAMLLAQALAEQDTETPYVIIALADMFDAGGNIRVTCLCDRKLLLPIGERRCPGCGQRYTVEMRSTHAAVLAAI